MTTGVPIRRARTPRRRLTVLLVLLVLLVTLVGGVGLLYASSFSAGPTTTLTGPTARVEVNGLVLTLRVAPGPYFLRELLPLGVSLTNHSNATLNVMGVAFVNVNECGTAFSVTEDGGSAPTYQLPTASQPGSCPEAFPPHTDLAPNQTMSATALFPLTASGHLTLTPRVGVYVVTSAAGGGTFWTGWQPFAGHEPSLHLIVAAAAPLNRRVVTWRLGTHVLVIAPPPAWSHLVYMSRGFCPVGDLAWRARYTWQPIPTPMFDLGQCAGRHYMGSYAVGAPGYAVASETMPVS